MTVLAAMTLLAACNPLGAPKPADALYTLRAEGAASEHAVPLPQTVKIALPEAAPGLGTEQIMLREGNRLNHYTGAAWAAPLPESVRNLLADALQRSGRFRAVGTDAEGITTDLTLLTDIRDWQVEGGLSPKVHVRAVLKVTESASRTPLIALPFDAVLPAAANRTEAIVEAFNQAANQMAQAAIEATAKAASQSPLQAPAPKKKARR